MNMELVNEIKGEIGIYITLRKKGIELVVADNILYVTKGNKAYKTDCKCKCFIDEDRNLGFQIDDKYLIHSNGSYEQI